MQRKDLFDLVGIQSAISSELWLKICKYSFCTFNTIFKLEVFKGTWQRDIRTYSFLDFSWLSTTQSTYLVPVLRAVNGSFGSDSTEPKIRFTAPAPAPAPTRIFLGPFDNFFLSQIVLLDTLDIIFFDLSTVLSYVDWCNHDFFLYNSSSLPFFVKRQSQILKTGVYRNCFRARLYSIGSILIFSVLPFMRHWTVTYLHIPIFYVYSCAYGNTFQSCEFSRRQVCRVLVYENLNCWVLCCTYGSIPYFIILRKVFVNDTAFGYLWYGTYWYPVIFPPFCTLISRAGVCLFKCDFKKIETCCAKKF